jgi:twitching motility protein PilT
MAVDLPKIFDFALKQKASDILITTGAPPVLRLNGELKPLNLPSLSSEDTKKMIYGALSDDEIALFEADKELDFSVNYKGKHRFRGNVFLQRGSLGASFRLAFPASRSSGSRRLSRISP